MTRREKLLAAAVEGVPGEVLERLFERGLIDLKACERLAVRGAVDRLVRQGTPRCGAMHAVAEEFCCSYEKVRGIVYDTTKF